MKKTITVANFKETKKFTTLTNKDLDKVIGGDGRVGYSGRKLFGRK